jgi:hypothetical protein
VPLIAGVAARRTQREEDFMATWSKFAERAKSRAATLDAAPEPPKITGSWGRNNLRSQR